MGSKVKSGYSKYEKRPGPIYKQEEACGRDFLFVNRFNR